MGPDVNHAPGHPEVLRIVAPNPGPMTLEGTNTYLYGADPCVVIDPGVDDAGHLEAIRAAAAERGGIGLVLLTHSHADHTGGADQLGAEVVLPGDGEIHHGLRALATPGHAADHVCFLADADTGADGGGNGDAAVGDRSSEPARGGVCFSGDLVLGLGSTIVPPGGGSLAAYMGSLRLLQAEPIELIAPGHGPWITDPAAKLAEYVEHREMRERRLLDALDRGERSRAALLSEAWSDIPIELLPMAAMAMEAHLEKLEGEGHLPGDLEA
jgi:glyoxylase-like metal-dependent hydrolase (beta-lactamase superfamily II)